MSKFIIQGGKPLKGQVQISGSKNAALALVAASILIKETRLTNVPRIKDIESMLEIIAYLGGKYSWIGEHELLINTDHLVSKPIPQDVARKLRASILFAGPMLARFSQVELPYPGGDIIGTRSLDTHLNAFECLGVEVLKQENLRLRINQSKGGDVVLEESSVTATENILLFAAGVDQLIEVRLAACEPHVQDLCNFLVSAGVLISGIGSTTIQIKGSKPLLKNAIYSIIPDELEVSAFAVLAAATRSSLMLSPIQREFLDSVLLQLKKMNVDFTIDKNSITILPPKASYKSFRIQTGLYPKLVTDHIPPFAVLATQAEGASLIHEWLYEARQSYIRELIKMGANAVIMDPHRALIVGPTPLYGKEVASYDIRSGMSMVVAALVAQGKTVISDIEHIDRGYEKLEERLQAIGADIVRTE